MVTKSDSMIQYEKWIDQVVRTKPKHTSYPGLLPFEPRHIVAAIALALVALTTILAKF